jgi:hypothetical protein
MLKTTLLIFLSTVFAFLGLTWWALESRTYVVSPIVEESGHPRIRAYMREKYGLRDWWVGVLFDTSRSMAVRLLIPDERSNE